MNFMTISEISKYFNVSTRMLRYYEEIGILSSCRKDDYAYRIYDEKAVKRLQQIIVLRKLRIPLKQIALIFKDEEQMRIIEVFQNSITELDGEITALSTIRDVLRIFISRLNQNIQENIKLDLLEDARILKVIEALSLSKINFKEERSMEELNKANEALTSLSDVRILFMPQIVVASSHYFGENPEEMAVKPICDFVQKTNLLKVKPDFRMFGFNNPTPSGNNEAYGYEYWITIPDDIEVPEPLLKKQFCGGLYAVHCIKMGDFHEWDFLNKWVRNSPEYEYDEREPDGMGGCLEEHLNPYTYFSSEEKAGKLIQLDLMIPIKHKKS